MSQKQDLKDAQKTFFMYGGHEILERDSPSWYWRRAVKLIQAQVKSLQANNTKVVFENQKKHRAVMLVEELHREITRLVDRVVLLERVEKIALKLFDDERKWSKECADAEARWVSLSTALEKKLASHFIVKAPDDENEVNHWLLNALNTALGKKVENV